MIKTKTTSTKIKKKTDRTQRTQKQEKISVPRKEEIIDPHLEGLSASQEKPQKIDPYAKLISEPKRLYIIVGVIILIFALLFGLRFVLKQPLKISSLDDLHDLNFQGKLDPDQGYIHDGFSFVKYGGTWHTRFLRMANNQTYQVELRYGPRDIGDIPLRGDYELIPRQFNSTFVTFDPAGDNLSHVALAAADVSGNLAGVLQVYPFAACTKNETRGCRDRPVVRCGAPGVPVIYLKETAVASIEQQGTCLIIAGQELDLVKAVDRWLLAMYGMMK